MAAWSLRRLRSEVSRRLGRLRCRLWGCLYGPYCCERCGSGIYSGDDIEVGLLAFVGTIRWRMHRAMERFKKRDCANCRRPVPRGRKGSYCSKECDDAIPF